MFDLYELKLPISLQNKLVHITRSQQGGHYLGAALMGSLSTLILSPCVTAPLIGALSYIAHSGNILLGSSALFCLGLGMGIPLLLIGTSASKILPNAGRWMNSIKTLFGFVMLAMAIYILQRILPPLLTMTLWGTLLIFAGIYSGALTSMTTKLQKFRQGVSIICLLYGILIFIGVSQGHDNPLQPLLAPNRTIEASIRTVKTVADADEAIAHAKGKPVMLDFYADWCTSCKTIAATVLQHPQIQSELKHFVVLKIDVTANSAESSALLRHFNVVAPPTFIFYDTQGNEVRLVGNTSSALFLKQLKNTLANRN